MTPLFLTTPETHSILTMMAGADSTEDAAVEMVAAEAVTRKGNNQIKSLKRQSKQFATVPRLITMDTGFAVALASPRR